MSNTEKIYCQQYPPLNHELLPASVKTKLANVTEEEVPILTEEEVWKKISQSKKPNSAVPGDVPKCIVQAFSPELTTPVTKIFQNIARSGHWPKFLSGL